MDLNWRTTEGFKGLFEKYYNPLCNYAYKILENDMYSEDAVHEVMLHIWEKRNSLHIKDGKLKSYMFRATRNKALELLRLKKALSKRESEFQSQKQQLITRASQDEDIILFREMLRRSVRQLPLKCKEVYLLRTENGLTFAEIAEHLNLAQSTVENHMGNAIIKLRELIQEQRKFYNQ